MTTYTLTEAEKEMMVEALDYLEGWQLKDGMGALDETINEIRKIVQSIAPVEHDPRIAQLEQVIESQKQTHDALLKRLAAFERGR